MHRRWLLQRTNAEYVNYLSKAASISPLFARILINRGVKTPEAAREFLDPGLSGLSDPFELTGMKEAVRRIKAALKCREKVLVHGDYDADGLTAASIMVAGLRAAGLDTDYFIPHRMAHGYGFGPAAVAFAKERGVGLIVTVDCGIVSFETAALSKREKIDLIITDHHEPLRKSEVKKPENEANVGLGTRDIPGTQAQFLLPEAVALINPKLDPDSRLNVLSGAGIAFKVVQALAMDDDLPLTTEDPLRLLDLAAIGTVADVVPLTGENRIILREGLKQIRGDARLGIASLKEVCGLGGKQVKSGALSFTLVPRINAAGRLGDATDVVRLFLSNVEGETAELSRWLHRLNAERQETEDEVYRAALRDLKTADPVIVLAGEGWHQGVIGVVASRIAEEFQRPAIIFSIQDGVAKGSARSIPTFDICSAFYSCRELLTGFGGHKQAAGVTLESSRLEDFRQMLSSVFLSSGAAGQVPEMRIDADIGLAEVNFSLLRELSLLEPVGYGNPEPLLAAKMLEVRSVREVGNNHIRMKLCQRSHRLDAIGFDMAAQFGKLNSPDRLDVVFTPSINEWNGGRYVQLVMKAFRPGSGTL